MCTTIAVREKPRRSLYLCPTSEKCASICMCALPVKGVCGAQNEQELVRCSVALKRAPCFRWSEYVPNDLISQPLHL